MKANKHLIESLEQTGPKGQSKIWIPTASHPLHVPQTLCPALGPGPEPGRVTHSNCSGPWEAKARALAPAPSLPSQGARLAITARPLGGPHFGLQTHRQLSLPPSVSPSPCHLMTGDGLDAGHHWVRLLRGAPLCPQNPLVSKQRTDGLHFPDF